MTGGADCGALDMKWLRAQRFANSSREKNDD
jgi:hypothetical protein